MFKATLLRCWGNQKHNLGLVIVTLIEYYLINIDLLIILFGVAIFPFISRSTHNGLGRIILECFRWEFGSQPVGTARIDRKKHKIARYSTTTLLK